MGILERMTQAVRDEGVDGWLLSSFHHRDRAAEAMLGLDPARSNSRAWYFAAMADGSFLRVAHAIEAGILQDLPGSLETYSSREELLARLSMFRGKRMALSYSERVPAVSTLDAGSYLTLTGLGIVPVSAAPLVQRCLGILDAEGIASHGRAAAHLHAIVEKAWAMVRRAYSEGSKLHEGQVRDLMLAEFEARGLETDHPPIVGTGSSSADPHYETPGLGERFLEGDTVQFDLWAKERALGSIYADISWVGVYAPAPSPEQAALFRLVSSARDLAVAYIAEALNGGRRPSGAEVDARVRAYLEGEGQGAYLRHRTGHGIDREVHGSGVNLDSVEFPDERLLLDGSCFSVEPGLYRPGMGMRTEIDVYIEGGRPVVSGPGAQSRLLTCGGRE